MIPAHDRVPALIALLVSAVILAAIASVTFNGDREDAREHRERIECIRARGSWVQGDWHRQSCQFSGTGSP